MRAARLLQPARHDLGSLAAPVANWAHPSSRGLNNLYVATPRAEGGGGERTVNPTYEGVNLAGGAPASDGSPLGSRKFVRHTTTANTKVRPRPTPSQYGYYWPRDSGGSDGAYDFSAGGAPYGWDVGTTGYAPATLMGLLLAPAFLSDVGYVLYLGRQNGAASAGTKIGIFVSNTVWRGVVGTGTTSTALDVSIAYGALSVVIMTTRSNTDHEFTVRNLVTGAISHVTSTTNTGTTGLSPTYFGIGYRSTTNYALGNDFADVYAFASWGRGMSRAEMIELSRDPRALWKPSIPYTILSGGAGPVVGDLDVTLGAATLSSSVTVPIVGDLSVTLGAATLQAEGSVPISANLAETLAPATLASVVQAGPGVVGLAEETLAPATLSSTVELDLIGELDETLAPATLAAFAQVGSVGPFAIRPTLHFT